MLSTKFLCLALVGIILCLHAVSGYQQQRFDYRARLCALDSRYCQDALEQKPVQQRDELPLANGEKQELEQAEQQIDTNGEQKETVDEQENADANLAEIDGEQNEVAENEDEDSDDVDLYEPSSLGRQRGQRRRNRRPVQRRRRRRPAQRRRRGPNRRNNRRRVQNRNRRRNRINRRNRNKNRRINRRRRPVRRG